MWITKLNLHHQRQTFDCGVEPLNRFIKQQANQLIKRYETVVYVAEEQQQVVGFYTLSRCEIHQTQAPILLKKQSPYTPIPAVLLGRLAVDCRYQQRGLGRDLLLHAMTTCKQLANMMGLAFVVVDAKDETAKKFYQRYGFTPLSQRPLRLCYPIKNIPD